MSTHISSAYQGMLTRISSAYQGAASRAHLLRIWLKATLLSYPIALAILFSVPFFVYGSEVGLVKATEEVQKDLKITSSQAEFLTIFMTGVPGMVGALFAGFMANVIGRRYIALIGGGAYVIGVVIIFFTREYVTAMVGQCLAGLSIGMGLVIGSVYMTELAPAATRDFFTTFPQVFTILGWIYSWIPPDSSSWRVTLLVTAVPCLVSMLLLVCLPDTPSAIVLFTGKLEDAGDSMKKSGAKTGERLARLGELQEAAKIPIHLVTNDEGTNAPNRRNKITWYLEDLPTVIGFNRNFLITAGLFVAQEFAREENILQHVDPVFQNIGKKHKASRVATIVLVCIKLIGAMVPMITTYAAGRPKDPSDASPPSTEADTSRHHKRVLLLISIGATAFFLAALGGVMVGVLRARVISHSVAFPLYVVLLTGASVSPTIGLGTLPWMYGPEAFPLLIRTPFFGLLVALKLGIHQLFAVSLPLLTNSETAGYGYLVFGAALMVGFVMSWFFFRDELTGKILVEDCHGHRLWSQLANVDEPHRGHQNVQG